MPKLQWDQAGQRLFETGVDRGVLYLEDDSGVPWNGLTLIEEDFTNDITEPVYFDGVKIHDVIKYGDFAATLNALYYPDEFLPYEGTIDLDDGFSVDGQSSKTFGLSFRTLVGNDLESVNHGYKIHILYNITAVPGEMSRETLDGGVTPLLFNWGLSTVPVRLENYRPTAHVIFDSRFFPADIMAAVEGILYGSTVEYFESFIYDGGEVGGGQTDIIDGGTVTSDGVPLPSGSMLYDGGDPETESDDEVDGGTVTSDGVELPSGGTSSGSASDARLPTIEELIGLATLWDPKVIVPNSVTGLATLTDGAGDLTQTNIPGVFVALPGSRLIPSGIEGFYTLP